MNADQIRKSLELMLDFSMKNVTDSRDECAKLNKLGDACWWDGALMGLQMAIKIVREEIKTTEEKRSYRKYLAKCGQK